ncbi:hypothetical protein [Nocardia farcinica]|uniref:hypothetical protein n=1 Tax=Nocardia farcinica TaxID=37329 RepID=UPI002457DBE2|nr:hypothetical protein [Nocardia farcinica]
MITTTYSPARAARKAAAKALRRRVRALIAPALARFLNGSARTQFLNSGQLVTISTALANLGADADLIRRYASHAGKKVKAAFKAATGRDPLTVWTVRNGRAIEVAAYPAKDRAIREGLAAYSRTAHLIPAAVAA